MNSYIYTVRYGEHGLRVEVGIFDPERWVGSQPENPGGIAFGLSAELAISEGWLADEGSEPSANLKVEVGQGSIGNVSLDTARKRADVYTQAIQMGEFCEDALRWGATTETLGEFLKGILPAEGSTTGGFRYIRSAVGRIVSADFKRYDHPKWTEASS